MNECTKFYARLVYYGAKTLWSDTFFCLSYEWVANVSKTAMFGMRWQRSLIAHVQAEIFVPLRTTNPFSAECQVFFILALFAADADVYLLSCGNILAHYAMCVQPWGPIMLPMKTYLAVTELCKLKVLFFHVSHRCQECTCCYYSIHTLHVKSHARLFTQKSFTADQGNRILVVM